MACSANDGTTASRQRDPGGVPPKSHASSTKQSNEASDHREDYGNAGIAARGDRFFRDLNTIPLVGDSEDALRYEPVQGAGQGQQWERVPVGELEIISRSLVARRGSDA